MSFKNVDLSNPYLIAAVVVFALIALYLIFSRQKSATQLKHTVNKVRGNQYNKTIEGNENNFHFRDKKKNVKK